MKRLPEYDVFDIPIESIFYDEEFNCRQWFTKESIQDLALDIKDNGLINPVVIQPWQNGFRIVAGHRRFKAIEFLGQKTIKASIRRNLTHHQAYLLNLSEGIGQKNLNILEEAIGLQHLYPEGVAIRTAAREIHKPERWVHIRLRLLLMPEEIQKQAAAGLLSTENLEAIAQKPAEGQIPTCRKIIDDKKHGYTLEGGCRRKFKYHRSKAEINRMIAKMLNLGIGGLAPRFGAWCTAAITTDEFLADIELDRQHRLRSKSKKYLSGRK